MTHSIAKQSTIFAPNEGKVISILGDTLTCKFDDKNTQDWRFFELLTSGKITQPLHTHPWDSGFYVLEGKAEVQIADRKVLATPGYFVNIPAGIAHTIQVISPEVKLLAWVSNTGAEKFFEELASAAQEVSPYRDLVAHIRQKHYMVVNNSIPRKTVQSTPRLATVFAPNEGEVFSYSGITITCKSNSSDTKGWRFFENASGGNTIAPLHTHPWDEGFYILEGEMKLQIEDRIVSATPGYCINVPAGIAHGLIGSPGVKFLSWVSNTKAEKFIQELNLAMQESSPSPELLGQIRQKHHILIRDAIAPSVN